MHVLNSVGGVDVSLRLILENIDPEQFENVVVHGVNDTKKQYLNKHGEKLKEFKFRISREINLFNDLLALFNTIKILKKEKPNLVHAHSAKGGIIARAASLFYKTTVLHTPQAYSYLSAPRGLKRTIFLSIEKLFKNFNSILLASSKSELERGINEVGYKKTNTLLFNNSILPIELNNSEIQHVVTWPKSYICSVGRPSYQKNVEMMVEVIKCVKDKIPSIHLVLMGIGEYSPNVNSVKELIKKYGLEKNITLVKWIKREEIFKIVYSSTLYVSTARYEGLPYSIIESLALSKACVVTDADGNRDLVIDGENGFLVKNNDIQNMADKICRLIEDKKLRNEMEQQSLNLFNQKFNMSTNIIQLEKIYEKLAVR
ncbi:glycosyltransferase involved in cell wall biosynthesis [Flagellimonas meridianipacifica]|uniref:Glycosyltransferase involved in cell wall biosynthesis n=2 Tax=Flagellimonas meridianipacifica TaxID=1080225 RepID=A0A2T0MH81_9FLAO|nr:glycosyltransferase involved in cell wall biosynthesis [Allomuricauda pacifica]